MAAARVLRPFAEGLLILGLLSLAVLPDRFVLRPKLMGQTLVLLSCGLALGHVALTGRLGRSWARVFGLAALPAALGLIHLTHSDPASWSLAHDEIQRLLLVPLLGWLVANVIACERSTRGRLLMALAVGTAWVSAYALLQSVGGYRYLDFGIATHRRAHGGFENPVFLGGWLVLSLPPLLAGALLGRGRVRWLCAVAAGLGLPALLATRSAGAWGGFGVALVVGLLLALPSSRQRRRLLALSGAGAALLAFLARDVLSRPRGHALIWRDTLAMVKDAPGGVGPGQYPLAFLPYASEDLLAAYPRSEVIINDAHSEWLQLAAELGWGAFGAVILLLLAGAVALRKTRADVQRDASPDAYLFAAAVAGLAGSASMSFVSPDLRFGVTPLLFGTLLGIAASFDRTPSLALPWGRFGQLTVAALAFGVCALGIGEAQRRLEIAELARPQSSPPTRPDPELLAVLPQLRDAIAGEPEDAARHAALGIVLEQLRRHREAAAAFRAALRRRTNDVVLARHLGVNEVLSGQYEHAVLSLEAVLEVDPTDADARYLLAYAHYARGNLLHAIREVEDLLERDPDHAQARVLREGLRE